MKNMTALICTFVKAYHNLDNIKVYKDNYSKKLLTDEEYNIISKNMSEGINFFNPNYNGNNPLKWIVNNQIGPSIIARSKFNDDHLENEISLGLKQYIVLGSGYDTSGYKVNKLLSVFELDKENMIKDKIDRIKKSNINNDNVKYIESDFNSNWINNLITNGFDITKKTFCSLLGISYYLDKKVFEKTLKTLSNNIPLGSVILFDYPNNYETEKERINKSLAASANEEMKSIFSFKDIEHIAEDNNLLIYEHLNNEDIDNNYFYDYNTINSFEKLSAPKGISYCMLVKR